VLEPPLGSATNFCKFCEFLQHLFYLILHVRVAIIDGGHQDWTSASCEGYRAKYVMHHCLLVHATSWTERRAALVLFQRL